MMEQSNRHLPGSDGEHQLQNRYGSTKRAQRFYEQQVLDHLNDQMRHFLDQMEMMFVSTADSHGNCDCSIRCGPPGFVAALTDRTLLYPELRGNGVMASLGNISENPHIGLLLVDFYETTIGLHINGRAAILESAEVQSLASLPDNIHLTHDSVRGSTPERWVQVEVEEVYIHCAKHIPRLKPLTNKTAWGTDDERLKGGDFFGTSSR